MSVNRTRTSKTFLWQGFPLAACTQYMNNSCEYFASPIVGDGKIYIAGENGVVVVLKDSDKYELLAKNDMGDAILATPAIADGSIFIRTRSKLICVSN